MATPTLKHVIHADRYLLTFENANHNVGKIITIDTNHTIDQCMAIMTDNCIKHLPIVSGAKLLGLISIGDVVREMIAYPKSMIEQLQSYITGLALAIQSTLCKSK